MTDKEGVLIPAAVISNVKRNNKTKVSRIVIEVADDLEGVSALAILAVMSFQDKRVKIKFEEVA